MANGIQLNVDKLQDYQNKYVREAAMKEDLNQKLMNCNENLEKKAREYKKKVEDIVEEKT